MPRFTIRRIECSHCGHETPVVIDGPHFPVCVYCGTPALILAVERALALADAIHRQDEVAV